MSVGNDALDDDHIVVASLINHIDDAKQSGTDEHAVGRILRVLVDHAFTHFAREEALLEQRGYPRLAEHKREHRLVEEELQELSREIMQILYFWLVEHIMKVDMHYKSFLDPELASDDEHQTSSRS